MGKYTCRYYNEGSYLIVAVEGKLDTISAPEFGETLKSLLYDKPLFCLLDFGKVDFLSSSGLQVLLAGAKISQQMGIKFAVFGMQEMVHDIFVMSGFDQFIRDFDTKENAVRLL